MPAFSFEYALQAFCEPVQTSSIQFIKASDAVFFQATGLGLGKGCGRDSTDDFTILLNEPAPAIGCQARITRAPDQPL
jgi:hypothetical protein